MNQNVYLLDIETGPLPTDQLARVKPEFKAPSNYKREDAIKDHIEEQERAWIERAALDAPTAQVLIIGVLDGDRFETFQGAEDVILTRFWPWLDQTLNRGDIVSGFCIFHFDLPMLIRRSFVHGVKIPSTIRQRYWHEGLVDIAERWQCGNRSDTISLDRLSKALGVGAKNGDGADFAALYATDKEKALAYLKNDLMLAKKCYEKMFPI
jgi:hypothetical protein